VEAALLEHFPPGAPPRRMHPGALRAPLPPKLPSGASTKLRAELAGAGSCARPLSGSDADPPASPPKTGLSRRRIYALLHSPPP